MGDKPRAVHGVVTAVPAKSRELLLVCKKCGGKLRHGGGFGPKGKDDLPDALRDRLRERGERRAVRIVEVGCLGVCPKDGVTVLRGSGPGEALIVPAGLDLAVVLPRLGIDTAGCADDEREADRTVL